MTARRPRVAYVTYGTGRYDARTLRMARTARDAGYDVTIYARWDPGLPVTEDYDGFRIVRAPSDWRLAVPGLRRGARRRLRAAMAHPSIATLPVADGDAPGDAPPVVVEPRRPPLPVRAVRAVYRRVRKRWRQWRHLVLQFPLRGMGWGAALAEVAQPADIWHGMWAGSLPAILRLRRRRGGRAIYDSRDIFMESRGQANASWPTRPALAALERRWAQDVDAVLTVNEAYATDLTKRLGVARPDIVMNLPRRWTPPEPAPDLIREALGLAAATRVVLYQGGLMTDRGIEQSMDAILAVPDAVLVLLGFGALRRRLEAAAAAPPYVGRVFVLEPVPPSQLLSWTASADVSVMMIQPSSLNHRLTTPQKLFESIAAGVPVVASNLPGMADIVREGGVGLVCDPTSPRAIAQAIRTLLDEPATARAARRAAILQLAHQRYNWEAEEPALLAAYARVLAE